LKAEAEWKTMLDGHAKAVSEWEELVEKLKAENVCRKDLPKKPKWPKKPKPVADEQTASEQDLDGGRGNDSDDSKADWEVLRPRLYLVVRVYLFLYLSVYVYHRPALPLLPDYFGRCRYLDT
jgi:hypothetical protein